MRIEDAYLAVNALAPGATFGRGRAAVVQRNADVAVLRSVAVQEVDAGAVGVGYGAGGGLSVYVKEHGVFFGGVKVFRPRHPAV